MNESQNEVTQVRAHLHKVASVHAIKHVGAVDV